jgi:superfamily II DNA or RNA helicase
MIDGFNKLNDFYNLDIDIYSISCENSNKERKEILKSFSENDDKIQLLFNIKILNECIDIPSCDSIYISYPPKNKITTIQRINRATRINKNNPYKIANIYIWCDEYEEILETLSSIKEYDSMFKDKIKITGKDLQEFLDNIRSKTVGLKVDFDSVDIDMDNRELTFSLDETKEPVKRLTFAVNLNNEKTCESCVNIGKKNNVPNDKRIKGKFENGTRMFELFALY